MVPRKILMLAACAAMVLVATRMPYITSLLQSITARAALGQWSATTGGGGVGSCTDDMHALHAKYGAALSCVTFKAMGLCKDRKQHLCEQTCGPCKSSVSREPSHGAVTTSTKKKPKTKTKTDSPPAAPASGGSSNPIFGAYWPAGKPKAMIHVLIQDPSHGTDEQKERATSRLPSLRRMFKLVDANFNDHYHYPIVVFVSPGFSKVSEKLVSEMSHSALHFVELDFKGPPNLNATLDPKLKDRFGECPKTWLGYRHMCRYHAGLVYREPVYKDVDYAMRLDDDSCFSENVTKDIFREMQQSKLVYAYSTSAHENYHCAIGLWRFAQDYVKKNGIKTEWFGIERYQWPEGRIVYNNFEVVEIKFWTSEPFLSFFEAIEDENGIYSRRWGDAPIKTLALQLFAPYTRIGHSLQYMHYAHASTCKVPLRNLRLRSRRTT